MSWMTPDALDRERWRWRRWKPQHGAGRAAIEGIRSHYQIFTTIDALIRGGCSED